MSIWASVEGVPEDFPRRDNYTGEDIGQFVTLDVATAPSWHHYIRLTATVEGDPGGEFCELLSVAEARALAAALAAAASHIERRTGTAA